MRTLAALVFTLGLVITPLQGALAQEGDDKGGEGGSGGGEGSGGGDSSAAEDPWKAPKAAEDKPAEAPTEKPSDGSIVVPPDPYPIAEIDRPLVLRPLVLEPRVWFFFDAYTDHLDNFVGLGLGASFGIIENLEAGLTFPLAFAPKVRPGELGIDASYELSSLLGMDGMWLAVRLDFLIQLADQFTYLGDSEFGMLLSTPFKYKLHDMFALTAKLNLGFAASKPSVFWIGFDVGAMVQPIDWVVIELLFGLDGWIGEWYGDDRAILRLPLTFRAVFTPIADLDVFAELGLPDLNSSNHYGIYPHEVGLGGSDGDDNFWIQIIAGVAYRFAF